MNIYLRDKHENLVIKDILTVTFDMCVKQFDDKYKVRVSRGYFLKDEFDTKKEAEEAMLDLAQKKDELEVAIMNEGYFNHM